MKDGRGLGGRQGAAARSTSSPSQLHSAAAAGRAPSLLARPHNPDDVASPVDALHLTSSSSSSPPPLS